MTKVMRLLVVRRRRLDDQADVDFGAREILEDVRGDARLILDVEQRDLGDLAVRGHADHRRTFHDRGSFTDPRAGLAAEAVADVDRHRVLHADLGGARMQHLGAARRQLDALLVAQVRDLPGVGHDPGVGGVDAVDVGAVLVDLRLERRRQHRAGDVAAAASERGDVVVLGHALKAGDDDDAAGAELLDQSRASRPRAPARG